MELVLSKIIYFCISIIAISLVFTYPSRADVNITGIDFLGQATLRKDFYFQKTPIGGLSGITYDPKKQVYYVISDDRSQRFPARFYTLRIDLSKGSLNNGDISIVGVTKLLNRNGKTFEIGTIDPEGIALTYRGTVFISSEGDAAQFIPPFIKEFSIASGREIGALPIPKKVLPDKRNKQGIRNNLAFESLTITPSNKYLFTATENALIQDGSEAKPKTSSPCRIFQYNLDTKFPEKEFLYETEPVTPVFNFFHMFASGLADLLALDNQGQFLSVERSFTGLGFSIALFQVSLHEADDIHNINSLLKIESKKIKPVKKKLVLDLKNLNIVLDNIEGLTLGPKLPDGYRSLILLSDNNFNFIQRTQVLAFRLRMES